MPLYKTYTIAKNTFMGVWEITESLQELLEKRSVSPDEENEFDSFSNENRKRQWLATRILIKELSGQNYHVLHDENGVPFLKNSLLKISISHTNRFVAVIISSVFELGVDIEMIHERVLKVKHKFLTDSELSFLLESENVLENICLAWSAKEALFKVFAKPNIDFKQCIFLKPYTYPESGEITASVCKESVCKNYLLNYYKIKDHMLVYVTSKN